MTPDGVDHAPPHPDAIRTAIDATRALTDPTERARLATELLADALDLATAATDDITDAPDRVRAAGEIARVVHPGRERALASRRTAIRQAIRAGWSDSDLARATGVPQPRVAEVRRRMRSEGESVPRSRIGSRSTRSSDATGGTRGGHA